MGVPVRYVSNGKAEFISMMCTAMAYQTGNILSYQQQLQNVKFKNKLLHDVDSAVTKSLKLLNSSDSNNIPVILVMSNAEIQKSMLASILLLKTY